MDTQLKKDWCKALENGEHQQWRGGNFTDGFRSYCCLAVLCLVAGKPVRCPQQHRNEGGEGDNYDFVNSVIEKYHVDKLWTMNDLEGKTFTEIAAWVRENL